MNALPLTILSIVLLGLLTACTATPPPADTAIQSAETVEPTEDIENSKELAEEFQWIEDTDDIEIGEML